MRIEIIEWPGSDLSVVDLTVDPGTLRRIVGPKPADFGLYPLIRGETSDAVRRYADLGWGSVARLRSGTDERLAIVGAAKYGALGWRLPVLEGLAPSSNVTKAKAKGTSLRAKRGYSVRRS